MAGIVEDPTLSHPINHGHYKFSVTGHDEVLFGVFRLIHDNIVIIRELVPVAFNVTQEGMVPQLRDIPELKRNRQFDLDINEVTLIHRIYVVYKEEIRTGRIQCPESSTSRNGARILH